MHMAAELLGCSVSQANISSFNEMEGVSADISQRKDQHLRTNSDGRPQFLLTQVES